MNNVLVIILGLIVIGLILTTTGNFLSGSDPRKNTGKTNRSLLGGAIDLPWYLGNLAYDPSLIPRTTRNMSYDIRGDPYIPFRSVSPWNNPEVLPIRW
ncbi:MAG: hypothetical protein WD512_09030 [Candidatus Paceibacterota bacterium]